jgi:hypothetical protein
VRTGAERRPKSPSRLTDNSNHESGFGAAQANLALSVCSLLYKSRIERKSEKEGRESFLDHWNFRWLYLKSKENGVAEYEDYEKNLTEEQMDEQ